jgi:membrane protease YdiL (CAAX protease family)
MTGRPRLDRGARRVVGATALVLGYGLLSQKVVPARAQLPASLAAASGAIALARRWELSWTELGLAAADAPRGVALGLSLVPPIVAGLATGSQLRATRELFADERVVAATRREATFEVLVRIPLATAATEELLFRGLLLALTTDRFGALPGALITSTAFGVWHVIPALHAHRSNPAGAELAARVGGRIATVAGTLAATTVAGLAFTGLRSRSRSLLAPTVAHTAVNALAFLAARRLGRPAARAVTA